MADRSYGEVTNDVRFFATMAVHSMRGPAATYGVLLEFMNEEGWSWPSKRAIAQLTGRNDPRNILRDLHWLDEKGLIEVGDSTGGIHTAIQRYRIDLDRLFELEAQFRDLRSGIELPDEVSSSPRGREPTRQRNRTTPELTVANSRPKPHASSSEANGNGLLARESLKAANSDAKSPALYPVDDAEPVEQNRDNPLPEDEDAVLTAESLAEKIAKFGLGYNSEGALEVIRRKWQPYVDLERIEREIPLLVTAYGGMQPPSDARSKVEAYMEHVIAPLRKQRQISAEKQELRSVWEKRSRSGEIDDDPFSRVWSRHLDIACSDADPTPAANWWDWIKQAVRTLGEDGTNDLLDSARRVAPEERYALLRDEIQVRVGVAQAAEHERRMSEDCAYAISYRYGERMKLAGVAQQEAWLHWLDEAATHVDAMTLANWHDDILRKAQRGEADADILAQLKTQYQAFRQKQADAPDARAVGDRRRA
jgi:hypothetical protein